MSYKTRIFVTTIGYTESSVYDILLVNISNLIKQFTLYVNRKLKKHSSDDSDIIMIDEMLNLKVSDYWLLWIGIGLSALVLRFESKFIDWTSGNDDINKFIQDTQISAHKGVKEALEWIPYDRFYDIEYIAKDGFG
ncbi:hypothetical protein RhiirA4_465874 [Rhizophagus irregularis]|uniref:Uncharacterized protein n=1 Tax=Rhizophagus irregularis TaxID=588596 RepID=A0A2I1GT00_9GLOM|nr:hypothetical protein RhiirA4_465874 [Rhizophagus irregularis]